MNIGNSAVNRGPLGVVNASSVVGLILATLILLLSACAGESQAEKHNSAGVFLETQDKLEAAIGEFDQAILGDPEFALAYYNRGQAYFKLEQYEMAIQDYGRAILLHSNPALILNQRGEAYAALGQYQRAIEDHDEAIQRDPKNAIAYYSRGGDYFEVGRRDQAIQDYGVAVDIDRRLNKSGYKCRLLEDLDGYQPAIKDCKTITRPDLQFAKAFGGRGSEFYELGQYRRAIRDYDKAINLDASPELYNKRGLAHRKAGDLDSAFDDFERATRDAEFAEPYFNRAGMYFDMGYYRFAIEDYDRAIRRNASDANGYAKRALAYIALEKDKEAQLDIDRAVDLGSDRVELEEAVQELKKQR